MRKTQTKETDQLDKDEEEKNYTSKENANLVEEKEEMAQK